MPINDSNKTDDNDNTQVVIVDPTNNNYKVAVDSNGQIYARLPGFVSSNNSTSTPLGISGVYTGTFEEILGLSTISISIFADKDSAALGLQIQWSTDGTNVDNTDDYNIYANTGKLYSFGINSRYFRVKYTNGVLAQTTFRLQTILHSMAIKPSSHRVEDNIVGDDDAELMKAVITGKSAAGTYRNVAVDNDGNLQITLAPGGSIIPTLGTALAYDDMNVANGGVARGSSITVAAGWTQVYAYTTTNGLLMGILMTLEDLTGTSTNYWTVRLVIDGNEIWGANGISTYGMSNGGIYNWNTGTTPSPTWGGLNLVQDTFRWDSPNNLPVTFSSTVRVYVRRNGTTSKNFKAGLVCIVKG